MNENTEPIEIRERPDEFWRKVYLAVIAATFVVITLLWAFSKYFSH